MFVVYAMKNSSIVTICLVMILALNVAACKPRDESILIGIYVADNSIVKEQLTLNSDGSFVQNVKLNSKLDSDTTRGRWTYDPRSGYISFDSNYMQVLNGLKKIKKDYNKNLTSAYLPVDVYFSCVLIGTSENVLYKKVGP